MYASTDGSTIASVTMQQSHTHHMTIMCYSTDTGLYIGGQLHLPRDGKSHWSAYELREREREGGREEVKQHSLFQPFSAHSSITYSHAIRRRITRMVILVTPCKCNHHMVITLYSHVIRYACSSHMTAQTQFLSVTSMVRYLCSSPTTTVTEQLHLG